MIAAILVSKILRSCSEEGSVTSELEEIKAVALTSQHVQCLWVPILVLAVSIGVLPGTVLVR